MGNITFIAPQEWLYSRVQRLYQSTEKSKEFNDNKSSLSCILIDVHDGVLTMQSECISSTTSVIVDDLEISGDGQYMIQAHNIMDIIKYIPKDAQVKVTYIAESDDANNSGDIIVSTVDGDDMTFRTVDVPIESDDSVPHALVDIPEKIPRIRVEVSELTKKYKLGSSMAKSIDSDQMAGADPLSACAVFIDKSGLHMFSLFIGASYFNITSDDIEIIDKTKKIILTDIQTTVACIATFSDNYDVDVFIDKDKMLYIADDDTVVAINSINIGEVNNSVTIKPVINMFNNMFKHIVVHTDVNAGTFFQSMSRIRNGIDYESFMHIGGNSIDVSTQSHGRSVFKQSIPSRNQWIEDDDSLNAKLNAAYLRKTQGLGKDDDGNTHYSFAVKDGSPWGIIAYNKEDFDEKNPTNFFLFPA